MPLNNSGANMSAPFDGHGQRVVVLPTCEITSLRGKVGTVIANYPHQKYALKVVFDGEITLTLPGTWLTYDEVERVQPPSDEDFGDAA